MSVRSIFNSILRATIDRRGSKPASEGGKVRKPRGSRYWTKERTEEAIRHAKSLARFGSVTRQRTRRIAFERAMNYINEHAGGEPRAARRRMARNRMRLIAKGQVAA